MAARRKTAPEMTSRIRTPAESYTTQHIFRFTRPEECLRATRRERALYHSPIRELDAYRSLARSQLWPELTTGRRTVGHFSAFFLSFSALSASLNLPVNNGASFSRLERAKTEAWCACTSERVGSKNAESRSTRVSARAARASERGKAESASPGTHLREWYLTA